MSNPFVGAVRHMIRTPDMDEALAIEWTLDAALEFAEDRLPWWEAAKIGAVTVPDWRTGKMIESTGYGRFLALVMTPASDPRRAALLELINTIVEQSGVVITAQGLFDRSDLHEHNVTVRSAA